MTPVLQVDVATDLRFFLPSRRRTGVVTVPSDADATLGHVVESLGVPLTEVGALELEGSAVPADARADAVGMLRVHPVRRPQRVRTDPPRFLLDVHLGSLARRMWLLGLDAAYTNDATDDELAARAGAEERVLLTQDRGLLRRRAVTCGAFVRGAGAAAQLDDVLDRFVPPLDPWTRCGACGGVLRAADADEVAPLIRAGTRRTYTSFARCSACGRPFWRGAHSGRLDEVVERARRLVSARRGAGR